MQDCCKICKHTLFAVFSFKSRLQKFVILTLQKVVDFCTSDVQRKPRQHIGQLEPFSVVTHSPPDCKHSTCTQRESTCLSAGLKESNVVRERAVFLFG